MLFTKHWKQIPNKLFSKKKLKLRPKKLLRTLSKMTGRKWSSIVQYPKWPLCSHCDVNSQWAYCNTSCSAQNDPWRPERWSVSSYTCSWFSFAKQVSFEHSLSSPSLLILREGEKNIQTIDRQMTRQKVSPHFVVDWSSARSDRVHGRRCSAATSSATASTGTVLLPSQMSQILATRLVGPLVTHLTT